MKSLTTMLGLWVIILSFNKWFVYCASTIRTFLLIVSQLGRSLYLEFWVYMALQL